MKIGIFGGSFNPPHNMHKKIALDLISLGIVDKIIFVPTGDNYSKSNLIDVKHRYFMLNLICENNDSLEVSEFEIKNNSVFTYQTLDYFQELYKKDEIFFIIGSDNLAQLDTWKEYDYLLKNYRFLVIKRKSEDIKSLLKKYRYNSHIILTDINMNSISSTKIRNMIKNNSKEVHKYIDIRVLSYILKNRLYLM